MEVMEGGGSTDEQAYWGDLRKILPTSALKLVEPRTGSTQSQLGDFNVKDYEIQQACLEGASLSD